MRLWTPRGGWYRDRHQRRRSESNRRIEVLQTSALPLGYGAGGNVTSRFTASSARVGARTGVPYLGALSNDDQNATLATMMFATTTASAWIKIPYVIQPKTATPCTPPKPPFE